MSTTTAIVPPDQQPEALIDTAALIVSAQFALLVAWRRGKKLEGREIRVRGAAADFLRRAGRRRWTP